jgi:hypothetical protein
MPYVDLESRERLKHLTDQIKDEILNGQSISPGDMNYLITLMCHAYLERKGNRYTFHNDLVGVLECAKQELYRRKTASYEDECIKKNGDV